MMGETHKKSERDYIYIEFLYEKWLGRPTQSEDNIKIINEYGMTIYSGFISASTWYSGGLL